MATKKGGSAFGGLTEVPSGDLSQEELETLFGEDDVAAPAPPAPEGEPEGEQPDAEPEQAEPQEQAPQEPQGEEPAAPAEEEHVAEPTSEEAQRKWAEKFDSPEDLERGYVNLQSFESRTRQQLLDSTARQQQLEAALGQALPMIEENDRLRSQLAQQRQGEGAEAFDTMDPQAMQAYVQRQVQEGIQAYVQQTQAPYQNPGVPGQPANGQYYQDPAQIAWGQQFEARKASAIDGFRKAHPQVTEGSVLDQEMYKIVEGYNLDPSDAEQLEMAWTIWEDPQSGSLLRANPHYLATPEGRNLFRQNAKHAAPQGAPANGGAPARQRSPQAHVETGGTGAPVQAAPGERPSDRDPVTGKPRDEFSDVLDAWNAKAAERKAFGF